MINRKFSIIIPSYNEGNDIRLSIESTINQDYPNKEIIVIDDSSDDTKDIIREYTNRNVRLLDGTKTGCCGARNLGMKAADGEIVVLLNGDVVLPRNFLQRVNNHYEAGADYVLVESRVMNAENFWSRFVEMQHRYESRQIGEKAEWTEGFSCRRQAALDVGLIPGNFKVRFCRDWLLGKKLGEAGFKKKIDLSIVVPHKAPDNFEEFWRVRKARGRFGSLMQYFLYERPLVYLFFKFFAKTTFFILNFILILPAGIRVYKISRYSDKPFGDLSPFLWVYFIQELARVVGEWEGWLIALRLK